MIDPQHSRLSIQRQRQLVSISRSAFYYQPAAETPLNLELMRLLDAQFLATPRYGSRQMTRCLRRQGYTDQGSPLTSPRFVEVVQAAGAWVSMDGRGRWMDNVFIERLWRNLKYECV